MIPRTDGGTPVKGHGEMRPICGALVAGKRDEIALKQHLLEKHTKRRGELHPDGKQ